MNWGYKLTIVFIVFASGISYLVYRCVNTPVDLVASDYYKQELAYQQVIDATRNANNLSSAATLREENGAITLRLPAEMQRQSTTGTVFFYCASNQAKDRQVPLTLGADGAQTIASNLLAPGHYTVKISWTAEGKNYFNEQSFDLR